MVEQLGSDQGYREIYLRPLLRLIQGFAQTGDITYAEVYADERRRYVSAPGSTEEKARREASLRQLLRADRDQMVEWVSDGKRDALKDLMDTLDAPLLRPAGASELDLVLVGDCLMTEMRATLARRAWESGVNLRTHHFYFSAGTGAQLDPSAVVEFIGLNQTGLVALSFLTFEGIPLFTALLADAHRLDQAERRERVDAILTLMQAFIEELRATGPVPILLHGVSGLPLTRYRKRLPWLAPHSKAVRAVLDLLNASIRELAQHTENCLFIDEFALTRDAGVRKVAAPLFPAAVTDGAPFHSSGFGPLVAREYGAVVDAYLKLNKTKALLVDFDHTLWSGVIGEGEVVHDVRAQLLLKELKDAGILLVAVSKNDPSAIRWDEMKLQPDDFVLLKIGWNQKVQSIEESIAQLDLGPDSFVFIDDNPVERDLVEQALPSITTMDPLEPATWQALRWLLDFPATKLTEESAKRTEMYRQATARKEALSGPRDYGAMMKSLGLNVEFGAARANEAERIHELTSRTNQFNTTTVRYTRSEIESMVRDRSKRIYVATLSDRFGALGIVGAVVVSGSEGTRVFESVIMSCRAMGFGLEGALISETLSAEHGVSRAIGRFVPSERNRPASGLFRSAGFTEGDTAEEWVLSDATSAAPSPEWLNVTRR